MLPEINLVAQSGIVRWPALRYNTKGQPEFRFTLAKSGPYPWSIPCCAIGHTAEKLASELDEGMPVLISAAELCYRKRATKSGEISRMEILVWHVQVGQPVIGAETSPAGEGDFTSDDPALIVEPVSMLDRENRLEPATKAGRTRGPQWTGKKSALN